METIRGASFFPQKLTQMFADTKKSYENVVQTDDQSPQLAALHFSLRIQKDRLLAWGLQWSDATAAQAVDIDGSLDRAGISDLVASIMLSIRRLLDEAEGLLSPQTAEVPIVFGDTKVRRRLSPSAAWIPANLQRLERILKDLTVSIDTLCDLSRPKVEDRNKRLSDPKFHSVDMKSHFILPGPADSPSKSHVEDSRVDHGLIASSCIASNRIHRNGSMSRRSVSLPPSYESVAAGSERRLLAYLSPLEENKEDLKAPRDDIPVLLDYGPSQEELPLHTREPDPLRYEELCLALARLSSTMADTYSGFLHLKGWAKDLDMSRCAYVYEVPKLPIERFNEESSLQPRSLLSFLQNGADTDGANMPALENRYRLALNAAMTLQRLHAMNVTHRSFNSDSIVFFADERSVSASSKLWKGPIIRYPYLTGFNYCSPVSFDTESDSDFSTIYHHPQLGNGQNRNFSQKHEYYSLGLVLLEIGLWMPLGKFWKSKYSRDDFKARLQNIYLKKLSSKCGTAYMKAVLYCMTAADKGTNTLDSKLSTLDTGSDVDFYDSVIKALEQCCAVDGSMTTHQGASSQVAKPIDTTAAAPNEHRCSTCSTSATVEIPKAPTAKPLESIKFLANEKMNDQPGSLVPARKIKVWSHDIPSLYTNYWTSTMFPKLEYILSKAISRWESYTIDLFMAGEESDIARPMIYLECTSTEKVRKILRHLNKELRLFDIKVVPGHVVRSKAGKQRRKQPKKSLANKTSKSAKLMHDGAADMQRLNPHFQQVPACGASIGACIDGKHLPPVTFGGTIIVDGERFGMSVHHMLEDDEDLEAGLDDSFNLRRSVGTRESETKYASSGINDSEDDSDTSSILGYADSAFSETLDTLSVGNQGPLYPFEISEEEDEMPFQLSRNSDYMGDDENEFWLSPDFEFKPQIQSEDPDDNIELGDTPGVIANQGQHLAVTQPAIDDVSEIFFSEASCAGEEHLHSHSFGHIHASSGLRRARKDNLIHEIDWALIKITSEREQEHNTVLEGARFLEKPDTSQDQPVIDFEGSEHLKHSYPSQILPSTDLPNLQVHCRARTSGLQSGTILPTMRMIRLPGRAFASHSWHVRGNFGEGGDSGAWVLDNQTGSVAGCVLAYGSKDGEAYIAPMDVLIEDVERVLGSTGKITLPRMKRTARGAVGYCVPMRDTVTSPAIPTSPPLRSETFGLTDSKDFDGKPHITLQSPCPKAQRQKAHQSRPRDLSEAARNLLSEGRSAGRVEVGGPSR
ncbi:hypothetical protein MMC25_005391 [Agyrium rufum]|nr:hypothetical protein [Agyrium rufum]